MLNRYAYYVVTLLLVLPGIYLRLANMEYMEFKGDEFNLTLITQYNVMGPDWVPISLMSSTGLDNPPGFIYLFSLPSLFTTDVMTLTSFIAMLNVISIGLLFALVRVIFKSEKMAALATILYASLPWAIIFSRKIWPQNCLTIFVFLFYLLIFLNIKKYSSIKIFFIFFLFSLISQIHMSAWFLLLPLIAFFYIFKIKMEKRDLLIGVAFVLATYAIYFYHHVSTDFSNINYFLDIKKQSTQSYTLEHMFYMFIANTGLHFDYLLGENAVAAYGGGFTSFWIFIFYVFVLGLVVVLLCEVYAVYHLFKTKQRSEMSIEEKFRVLSLMILVTVQLVYFVLKVPPHPHYAIVLFPLLVIMMATFLCRFSSRKWVYLPLCLIVVALTHYHFTFFMLKGVKERPQLIKGDYGKPYALTNLGKKLDSIYPRIKTKSWQEFHAGFKRKKK